MARIDPTLFYKYPDGTTIDTSEHSRNLFSTLDTRGIYSELNGNVDATNLRAGSSGQIEEQHIQAGETHRTIQASGLETLDYWDAAFGQPDRVTTTSQSPSGEVVDDSSYMPISGVSARIFVPYDCSMMLWQWSFYATVGRAFAIETDSAGTQHVAEAPVITHKAFLDGTALEHTYRQFPRTYFLKKFVAGGDDNYDVMTTEGDNSRHWDMSHLATNVKAGWHEISARLYMAENRGSAYNLRIPTGGSGEDDPSSQAYFISNRITFGIRNARCMAIL